MRVLILGISGMLGSTIFRFLSKNCDYEIFGTLRTVSSIDYIDSELSSRILDGIDVENFDKLIDVINKTKPTLVINCVGLVKQIVTSENPLIALPINSIFPHRLANVCKLIGARLIQISTDCVFSGKKGMYNEMDHCDARDIYGLSKLLGEVCHPHAITLRTSIIGHELSGHRSLIDWFLSQEGSISGYSKAIFSGLPTVELARVIRDYVIPNPHMNGLYHVSAEPISKFDLLKIVAKTYGKSISIKPDDSLVIDRSLDSSKFRNATGYKPESWPELIEYMHKFG